MDIHRARFVEYSPHTITAMAFSHPSSEQSAPPGLRLAVGRSNGDIEIWNPRHGWVHELTVYGARDRSIEGLCWAADSEGTEPRLFSIGGSTAVTEWDLATLRPRANHDCNAGVVWSLAASADARSLAVGCDDGSVVIVDIAGGPGVMEHSLICQRQESRVLSVCWAGEVVVGGCADARIRCWQVRPAAADATSGLAEGRGRLVATMRVDKSKTESTLVWSVSALPQRHQIVSGDSTGSIKFWDLRHHSLLQSFAVHDADVLCAVHDASETRVFSAGVDRKIHQFQLVTSASSRISKWVHANSRLLHANDVRAMAVYEARGASVLASGGVERSVVLSSVSHFADGRYRKLAATQRAPVEVSASGLVAMWRDQTVKVWRVADDYRLVAKLSLSSDENVVQASVNAAGSMVAVATVGAVKVFGLAGTEKLQVSKVRDGALEALGAKRVAWARDALVVLTPDDEVYLWDGRVRRIATVGGATTLAVSPNSQHAAIARLDGTIEVVPLAAGAPFVLTRTSVQCMAFTAANTLAVVGADNKFHEFSLDGALLTAWSRRNSEFLPKQFLQLDERPQGMFAEGSRMWVYGANWMAFFDLAENIPINKAHQNTAAAPRKRHRDGLQIEPDDGGDDDDDGVEIVELRQSQVDRLRQQIAAEGAAPAAARAFWMTTKYRPILAAGPLAAGVIVVEMPSVSATPAFNLPKFRI